MARKGYPSDKADQFVVRMPDGMRNKIAEAAKRNGRSMNAEIIFRLEATFDITKEIANTDCDDPKEFALLGLKALKSQTTALTEVIEAMEQKLRNNPGEKE